MTIRSIVVNHLQSVFEHDNVAVVWIYCNYKVAQTPLNLVASLLKRLVQRHSAISLNVKSFHDIHKVNSARPTLNDFMDTLRSEIGMYSKVFVIVDALDECLQGDGTRAVLLAQLQSLPSTVNLMVTSRYPSSITRDGSATRCLEIRAHNDDVRRYVLGRIPREYRLATHINGHATLQAEIIDKIVENMGGMSVS
ncbi:hypothetical protein PILCRDRAFT_111027 [Piloderma croceum F 1598]|uniref:Nephrocystin 3-like N-terminal domain-containing protein n=1 Tax=Piloderma croceum (strain F 1598) TaxID=765440 RepID=A0A0C3GNF4_PILCF|nr:hypothetical protein PILCRDRAFT_111027 [Piloderma croceum F 1598]